MRLFVAVDLDHTVAGTVAALVDELARRVGRQAPGARVAWVPPHRMHLTLVFIGAADPERGARIERAMREPVGMAPFAVRIAGIGAFPGTGRPRVIWAGVDRGRESLLDLERRVAGRLASVGVAVEERPYRPHLTLGRVREAAGLRTAIVFDGLEDVVLGATAVEAITLFESRASADGPSYVAVGRTRL